MTLSDPAVCGPMHPAQCCEDERQGGAGGERCDAVPHVSRDGDLGSQSSSLDQENMGQEG